MRLWHLQKKKQISGPHDNLSGDIQAISGDCTDLTGDVSISGDVSGLKGCLTGLTGTSQGLSGSIGHLCGNISGITGKLDSELVGDVSGLRGNVTAVWGQAGGLHGEVHDFLDKSLLWPKAQALTLEMFASRYNLPMEFLDYSSSPALVAFHVPDAKHEHWLMIRPSSEEGFVVGPLDEIQKRFLGQEVTKVAVPSSAVWHASKDLRFIQTDRICIFEHITSIITGHFI